MRITYIEHSGFMVELDSYVFIFDYFKGDLPSIDSNKQVIFFVSHKHRDHFNKKIFTLGLSYEKVIYLLSSDTKMNNAYMDRMRIPNSEREKIRYIHANEAIKLTNEVQVETLKSTDQGVAFLVTCEGKSIYHAGDLNWWSWGGEPESFNEDMRKSFMEELMKVEGRHFDVAFLPLDPRQEERFYWGFDAFMKKTDVSICFPMHMWDKLGIIQKLKTNECSRDYRERVMDIKRNGEQFIV